MVDNKNRWYDHDLTISLAISILRNANRKNQLLVADYVIQRAKEYNIPIKKIAPPKIGLFFRRWYDFDERLHYTLEYLRLLPDDAKKSLSIEMISYLCELDVNSNIEENDHEERV